MSETPTSPLPARFLLAFRIRVVALVAGLLANILILARAIDVVSGMIVFAAAVVAYAIVTIVFWRCPHCSGYPGNAVMPDFCEQCGGTIFGHDAHIPDRPPRPSDHIHSIRGILIGRAAYGFMLLVFFAYFGSSQSLHPALFWLATIVLLLGGALIEWRWWRCPHCGAYLKRSLWPGRTCTKCGTQLRV